MFSANMRGLGKFEPICGEFDAYTSAVYSYRSVRCCTLPVRVLRTISLLACYPSDISIYYSGPALGPIIGGFLGEVRATVV